MGWLFNKNNSNQNQNQQSQTNDNSQSSFHFKKSFYGKKKRCQIDPEDPQFVICKTIIKDQNGTREEQERIPINASHGENYRENSEGSTFGFPFRSEVQKSFDKFQSFFTQPSFFDFHNSVQEQNYPHQNIEDEKNYSYNQSYSQSKTCSTDPENNQYLICKSKIFDGNQIRETEERIKKSDSFRFSFDKVGEFDHFGQQIDKQMHEMLRQMNREFSFITPFVGSFMNFLNDFDHISHGSSGNKSQNESQYFAKRSQNGDQRQSESSQNYFSGTKPKKDTNIYDL